MTILYSSFRANSTLNILEITSSVQWLWSWCPSVLVVQLIIGQNKQLLTYLSSHVLGRCSVAPVRL